MGISADPEPMRPSRARLKMCIVNPRIVDDIAALIGSQTLIMRHIGISWNSWIKISAGLPVRLSVGQRLKARVLPMIASMPDVRRRFPSDSAPSGFDREALDKAFLHPVVFFTPTVSPNGTALRSVERARQIREAQHR